jgi:hypothetical protein
MSHTPTLTIESTKGRRLFVVGVSNRVLIANASRDSDTIEFASRPVPEGDEIVITLNGVPHAFTYAYAKPDFDEILLRRPVSAKDLAPPEVPVPVKVERSWGERPPEFVGDERHASPHVGGTGGEIMLHQAMSPGVRPFDPNTDEMIDEPPNPSLTTLMLQDGKIGPVDAPPPD